VNRRKADDACPTPSNGGAVGDWCETGPVILTFLAGAELDPQVMRREWKQATIVGLVAFTAPFLGCAAVARFL